MRGAKAPKEASRPGRGARRYLATYVAVAVLLVLGVYVAVFERGKPADDQLEGTAVWAVQADRVQRLELDNGRERVVLARDGQSWRVVQPVAWPADTVAVRELLDSVAGLKAERTVAEEGADLSSFGLVRPSFRLQVELAGGQQRRLLVGDKSPVADSYYVQVEGSPAVYLVSGWWLDRLRKSAHDLRDKRVANFPVDQVRRVRLIRSDTSQPLVELVRQEGTWRMAAPFADLAEADEVESLLWALNGLVAEQFVDRPGPASSYGLDRPRLLVELQGEGPSPFSLRVSIGREAGDRDSFYVQTDRGPTVYRVRAPDFKPLGVTALGLLRQKLLEVDGTAAEKVVFHRQGEVVTVAKGRNGWTANGAAVSDVSLAGLWDALSNVRVRAVRRDRQPSAVQAKAEARVEVTVPGRVLTLALSREGSKALAVVTGRPYVYEVESGTAGHLADVFSRLVKGAGASGGQARSSQ